MDSFSRNNYVIVGSRTLHCEPPQVYQPTPDPPPPGEHCLEHRAPASPRFPPSLLLSLPALPPVPAAMSCTRLRAVSDPFTSHLCDQNRLNLNLNRPLKNQPHPLLHQVTYLSLCFHFPNLNVKLSICVA
jgi:hypothetical protein